ncbi:N(4)-(beta-N-acetylglucosaminyl)-L-asparaginase [Desemzia sp. RIT804]|uniref:N(4)-(beta-N-acetylglucosaminyl)-L-asparaginase n=1 Tax=Desemzia sp. RIT 804 TaxID=2810209 RepID=UPI0019516719|nr:N(4)-(beta-N-acetylglucosaminyl)-L-asparaginase [Desemzia sp. RIT 804]MBM6615438.1 N(4)-(beta-N-acetylglucosaminyl)-L-asparaginase [Desemzia sp. RIT 804]
MTYGMIATWRMAYEGVIHQSEHLADGSSAGDVLEGVIKEVEEFANFISVGYGGLPNEDGTVQLDAAFMDGTTFETGAVAGLENIKNPISVARKLSKERFNSFLIAEGAKKFAVKNGFEQEDLLTEKSKEKWEEKKKKIELKEMTPYDGHDTIGMVVLDKANHMAAGTSSSGLFMKKNGRVGDSPLPGSGFYVDSDIGGAAATGLGEDLMKGMLSYETVRKMEEGLSPEDAAQRTLEEFEKKLERKYGKVGAMSLVCMNNKGEWGIATNVEFTFVIATKTQKPTIYISNRSEDGQLIIEKPTKEWMKDYQGNLNNRIE